MHTFLLTLHLLGVATWFGANMVLAFVGPRVQGADPAVRAWWAATQGAMARVLYNIAGVLVLITGIALVIEGPYSFASAFVSIGFLAIIVGAVLGMAVYGPGCRKLTAAIDSGDEAEERSLVQRLSAFGALDSLVILVTIISMVAKWGFKLS